MTEQPTHFGNRRTMLAVAVAALVLPGAGCTLSRSSKDASIPVAFDQPPTLEQLTTRVNENSARVNQLHAKDVRLKIPGQIGSLQATLDFERERRFRLTGKALGSPELDLGSNDEVFWLWAKRMPAPTVFYGRHDQFFISAAQQFLPMPPHWIVEALGIVHFDSQLVHDGPYASNGLAQIRTRIPTARGDLLRVVEVDPRNATVVSQVIYDASLQRLASARCSQFRHDPLQNVTLPHRVELRLESNGLTIQLEIPAYQINAPISDPLQRWSMPEFPAPYAYRDVANPADMQPFQGYGLLGPTAPPSPAPTETAPGDSRGSAMNGAVLGSPTGNVQQRGGGPLNVSARSMNRFWPDFSRIWR